MDIELKHTWRISKRAWYIRLYLWVWGAEEADVTFCKLWWAYVFMWLAIPIRLVLCGYDRVKRISIRVNRLLKRVSVRAANWLMERFEQEAELYQAPVKPVVRYKPYRPVYPGERYVGEQSVVGGFLVSLLKFEPLRAKIRPRSAVVDLHPVPDQSVTMQRILESIATTAAAVGMKGRAVSYAVGQGVRNVGFGLLAGVFLVGGALRTVVVKPVAYGAGGVAAFFMCTGQLLWAGIERSSPYLERALTAVGKVVWLSLWPLRKSLSWIGRYLGTAGTVLAVLWAGVVAVGYVAAVLYVVGVSVILHPLIVLLILGSFGALAGFCIGLGFLIAYAMEKWFAPMFFREVIQPAWKGTEKGSEAIAAGTVGFGRIMLIGFKAVKSNTCPKIEVEE